MRSSPVRRCTTKRRRTADPAPLKRGFSYALRGFSEPLNGFLHEETAEHYAKNVECRLLKAMSEENFDEVFADSGLSDWELCVLKRCGESDDLISFCFEIRTDKDEFVKSIA